MPNLLRVLLLLPLLLGSLGAKAEPMGPERTLESLFEGWGITAERFAPSFLAQVLPSEVERIVGGLTRELGALQAVERSDAGFTLRFAEAEVPARIALDGEGRIAGLWFGAPQPLGAIAEQAAAIAALPGETALLVLSDGETVAAANPDRPLAVGSAAKLAVLLAVKRAVDEERLAWDRVVPLEAAWRSLPTGQLQDWPAGTPVTVSTLANLMISISDNTATDALIQLVGRDAVEAVTPRNAPFPTTRELFVLKAEDNAALRDAWRAGDAAARRALLGRIAEAPLPPAGGLSQEVTADIEWFMTARELCDLLDATTALPALAINPGAIDPEPWQAVAYKGGSEPGVLNLSARLVGRDGRTHCVVATWNGDASLDDNKLVARFRAIVARLAAAAG